MNLQTDYLGLKLKNPLVAGASPLAFTLDSAQRLEDAGASAVVMHSLFQEQLEEGKQKDELPSPDFAIKVDDYLEHLQRLKSCLSIPVIASLNGVTEGGWTSFAQLMQDAGADAIELNLYFLPSSEDESSAIVEQRCFQIVREVRQFVQIPVAVKLSPSFTSLAHFVHRLEEAGASSVVLFNRFFQPDIDIERLAAIPRMQPSTSADLLLRLRWLATLHGRSRLKLAASGGIHTTEDLVKAIMAGADAVQVVSALLQNGPEYAGQLINGLEDWMEQSQFESLEQLRGCMSYINRRSADVVGRANYIKILQSWPSSEASPV